MEFFSQQKGAKHLNELPELIEQFVTYWVQEHGKNCKTIRATKHVEYEARNPIQQMLKLVLPDYQYKNRKSYSQPFVNIAPDFLSYLKNEKGLRNSSVNHYVFYLRRFETYLKKINLNNLNHVSSIILNAFITESKADLCRTSVSNMCCTLKVFFRYLYREQLINKNINNLVEVPKKYQLANIPRSISWEEIQRMLDWVDRRTSIGKRDFAMLLLLITYGLRAHEVAKITLDDIDWNREKLRIPERKAGHSTTYPLSNFVAEAIIVYLKEARPNTENKHLFFRTLAPYKPIFYNCVSSRVMCYLNKAGITVHRGGSHTLRHSCVQHLLEANLPLKTIGDYVGHRSPSSTKIYTKIDLKSLREVAANHGEEVV